MMPIATARQLEGVLHQEGGFVSAIAAEIAEGRLSPKEGEKLILHWYQNRPRVAFMVQYTLTGEA